MSLTAALVGALISWGTICLHQDGHVSFEASLAGRCISLDGAQSGDEPRAANAGLRAEQPCCGPCTDLRSASEQWLERSPAKGRGLGAPPHTAGCLPAWAARPGSASPRLAVASFTHHARPAAPRSTVLRC